MKYATLCSGVDGFGLGFDRVGMQCVYQCEVDPQCRSVLARRWPDVERGMDVNDESTVESLRRLRPDLVAFGSPCQDLSVAGKRSGLAGERSGLFFRCVELCLECDARWIVWENVPGVFSSNGGRDFAAVIAAFTGFYPSVPAGGWRRAGIACGPIYSIAWRVLDSQYFGLAQRRKRVFVVGYLGNGRYPAEVLLEPESLCGDSPPSREAGARVAGTPAGCLNSGGNAGGFRTEPGEHLVAGSEIAPVARCLNAGANGRLDFETETFVVAKPCGNLSGSIAAEPGMKQQTYISFTLEARSKPQSVATTQAVRRLLPVECERLQGFPCGWSELTADGKTISDSARCRMMGNAVSVPVAEWIGRRIVELEYRAWRRRAPSTEMQEITAGFRAIVAPTDARIISST